MGDALTFGGSDTVLVANRGEIAVRIVRAARELGLRTVAVYATDDAEGLHVRLADEALALDGAGARAYLDGERLVALATQAGAGAVHPGYGFLSEQAVFAKRCRDAGLVFVGPRPEVLELFGDKAAARRLADSVGVPILAGTAGATSLEDARAFLLAGHGSVMIKAVAGGGGRGMRPVRSPDELDAAYERCRSEAQAAFGIADVYLEELLERPRHLEVQIVGDGTSAVTHLGERDCSIQRRHQKLVEMAPAPFLDTVMRGHLTDAALRIAAAARYDGVGTVEFLVEGDRFVFIEANARLQVEHTVTEEVTGVDLVAAQLRLAAGATLADLGLAPGEVPAPRGFAIQARVNLETLEPDGTVRPSSGTLATFELPSGPGVRVDTGAYAGYRTTTGYDSLLVKVIGHSGGTGADIAAAASRTGRALAELRIDGVATNVGLLRALLAHPALVNEPLHTGFLAEHLPELLAAAPGSPEPAAVAAPTGAGARIDTSDPLAVLAHGTTSRATATTAPPPSLQGPDGTTPILAPMQGTIVMLPVAEGDAVRAGDPVAVMEAMKMEHLVGAPEAGHIRRVAVTIGDTVFEGHPLAYIEPGDVEGEAVDEGAEADLDTIRHDLADVHHRQALTQDEARPDAVERRRKTAQRTARENVNDLVDPGSFVEWGSLAIAAQRSRRAMQDLIERTPADGLVAGTARVNGDRFDDEDARCIVMSYDYTVLAGTQGILNHRKKDRLFELAERMRLPVVLFTEGGGGRPGDTDAAAGVAGLDCLAFLYFGQLSGLVPLVGINSGRCFAGNAALLGCCDVVIATANSSIGMGGPAMIEGGGLGVFHPDEVGPMDVQVPNGVVDIPVADEAEAVQAAKQYLSYFQGPVADWTCADQRLLRQAIPENRLRVYDVRNVIDTLADTGSVLELRRAFGPGMITALIRVEGRPLGLIANDPTYLAGAITSEGSDKAARFMQLCDAFDLPILTLCDTPGMMVGPEVEKTALVRHCSRMFVTGASLTVPFFTVVLRKGYGLGAQAMAGGSFHAPIFTVAWPTGEFGGMGLEGAVKLGFRNELAAIADPLERKKAFDERVARSYEHGKALNTASHFEIDDVIDPVDTRLRIVEALRASPAPPPRASRPRKRPCIDTW